MIYALFTLHAYYIKIAKCLLKNLSFFVLIIYSIIFVTSFSGSFAVFDCRSTKQENIWKDDASAKLAVRVFTFIIHLFAADIRTYEKNIFLCISFVAVDHVILPEG